MLEAGTVYLTIPYWYKFEYTDLASIFKGNKYTCVKGPNGESINWHITTNLRVLTENNLSETCTTFICEPTKWHERRVTLRLTTSIGITRELIRHRAFSFANESTRYCNYSTSKFDNELTFIAPSWLKNYPAFYYPEIGGTDTFDKCVKAYGEKEGRFINGLLYAECLYLSLLDHGATAQEARDILPLATKSDIVMTGFIKDWQHFFLLRYYGTTGKPHPDMKELAGLAKEALMGTPEYDLIFNSLDNEKISNN